VNVDHQAQGRITPDSRHAAGNRPHVVARHPGLQTKAKATLWHPKLDFRGKGGIIVIPPSQHQSGHCYAWVQGQSLSDIPLPDLPPEIVAALAPPPRPTAPPSPAPANALKKINASPATLKFLAGEFAEGPRWHDRLFRAACDLAGRQVPLREAEPLLLAGARPWDETEAEAARRTIQSAYDQAREPGQF
jgi:hypothetical protein